jgi:hypothetical protein
LAKLIFLCDDIDNLDTDVGHWVFYKSPFVHYVASDLQYRDMFGFVTLHQFFTRVEAEHKSDIYVLALGVWQHFHRSLAFDLTHDPHSAARLRHLIDKFKSSKTPVYLLIDMSWECSTREYVEAIPMLSNLLDYPIRQFIYIGNHPLTSRLSPLPSKLGYAAIGTWFFEFYTHALHADRRERPASDVLSTSSQGRIALCLNRRVRMHRVLLAAYLSWRNYLPSCFFSYGGRAASEIDNHILRKEAIDSARELAKTLPDFCRFPDHEIDKVLENEPFEIDVSFATLPTIQDQKFVDAVVATPDELSACYAESLLSIVSETDFGASREDFLLTEKSFKPIVFNHPFVILSGPGTLFELQRLGYDTYGSVIGGRYDQISDPALRFSAIAAMIDHVFTMCRSAPDEFRARTTDIARFNRRNFIEGVPGRIRQFVARLIAEIEYVRHSDGRHSGDAATSAEGPQHLRFSRFGGVSFDTGFYEYEPAYKGRWCSITGTITFWLPRGSWELTVFVRGANPATLPDIYCAGVRLTYESIQQEARFRLKFRIEHVVEFLTLQFCSKGTFVPARADRTSTDERYLSFWLCDDFVLCRAGEAPRVSSIAGDMPPLGPAP